MKLWVHESSLLFTFFSNFKPLFCVSSIRNNLRNFELFIFTGCARLAVFFSLSRQMNHETIDVCSKFFWKWARFFIINSGHRWHFSILLCMLYFLCIVKNSVAKLFGCGSTVNCRLWFACFFFVSVGVKNVSFFTYQMYIFFFAWEENAWAV